MPRLRPARREDADILAQLTDYAGHGMPAYMWAQAAKPGESAFDVGRERFQREEANFSYRNAWVIEVAGAVAAGLIGYRQPEPYDLSFLDKLPEILRPLVRLEAEAPGSWYVNVVAVLPEQRGKGLGSLLLADAERRAHEVGARSLSLIAAEENAGAVRLYARLGYRELARRPVVPFPGFEYGGDWVLMAKPVEVLQR
jgi:ribosomal protein S18 acetylase RimI-like enzyme